jgi:hypothetical protein
MIMIMRCEYFFDEVYEEKSGDKCIYCPLCLFERFWENMNERNRQHRTSPESDEEIQNSGIYFSKKVENKSSSRYQCEDEKREEHKIVNNEELKMNNDRAVFIFCHPDEGSISSTVWSMQGTKQSRVSKSLSFLCIQESSVSVVFFCHVGDIT